MRETLRVPVPFRDAPRQRVGLDGPWVVITRGNDLRSDGPAMTSMYREIRRVVRWPTFSLRLTRQRGWVVSQYPPPGGQPKIASREQVVPSRDSANALAEGWRSELAQ
jgi:hypothetical protein